MNTPNKLTVARMIITPVFLAVVLMSFPHKFIVSAFVFIIASLSDFIDGRLARKNNQITVFGKLLDPVADKMLTTAAMLAFMQMGLCSVWVVMVVLTREFAITSVRLIASAQGVVIAANIWGKIKTACQMSFTVLILILGELQESFDIFGYVSFITFEALSNILLWITAVLAVVSGVTYLAASRKAIDFSR